MNNIIPPLNLSSQNSSPIKKNRNSNLELYRIIVMLLIVAHHSVVNSGILNEIESFVIIRLLPTL